MCRITSWNIPWKGQNSRGDIINILSVDFFAGSGTLIPFPIRQNPIQLTKLLHLGISNQSNDSEVDSPTVQIVSITKPGKKYKSVQEQSDISVSQLCKSSWGATILSSLFDQHSMIIPAG